MAKLIPVIGPPNSGKTTFSVVLSLILAEKGFNVCIVSCDNIVPAIPVLIPQSTLRIGDNKSRSIGKLLTQPEISTNDILQQMTTLKNIKRITLLGYSFGENKSTYPIPIIYDAVKVYTELSKMVDFIVVDGTSDIENPLTSVAIENGDVIIRVGGTEYGDIAYYASYNSVINSKLSENNLITVFPKTRPDDALNDINGFYGNIDFTLSYIPEIEKMKKYGEYFLHPFPAKYKTEVESVIGEINCKI